MVESRKRLESRRRSLVGVSLGKLGGLGERRNFSKASAYHTRPEAHMAVSGLCSGHLTNGTTVGNGQELA